MLTGCKRPASCGGSTPGAWLSRMMRPRPAWEARRNSTTTLHWVSRCAMIAEHEVQGPRRTGLQERQLPARAGGCQQRRNAPAGLCLKNCRPWSRSFEITASKSRARKGARERVNKRRLEVSDSLPTRFSGLCNVINGCWWVQNRSKSPGRAAATCCGIMCGLGARKH